jgi:hypothetical protein
MDEDEYRKTYQQINETRCIFEKALCSLNCACSKSKPFRLADRTCYGCHSPEDQKQCIALLKHLRNQTKFVFKINEINGPFPHNKEIRVQNGGLLGLQKLVDINEERVADVQAVVSQAIKDFGSIDGLPFDLLMQSIMAFKARPKRKPK